MCLGNYKVKILSLNVELGEKSPVKRNSTLSHEGLHFSIIRWSPSWAQHVLTGTLEGCVVLWSVPQDSDSQFSNVPLFVFGTFLLSFSQKKHLESTHTHKHTQEIARTQY